MPSRQAWTEQRLGCPGQSPGLNGGRGPGLKQRLWERPEEDSPTWERQAPSTQVSESLWEQKAEAWESHWNPRSPAPPPHPPHARGLGRCMGWVLRGHPRCPPTHQPAS